MFIYCLYYANARRGLGRHTLFILTKRSSYNERSDWLKAINYSVSHVQSMLAVISLEETDSDAAAMRLFKVIHNQAIAVTDLVVKRGRKQKTTAEYEMGATNIKIVHFSLHLFHASCLLSYPESRAPPGHCRGQRSLETRMVAVLLQLGTVGRGRVRELGLE